MPDSPTRRFYDRISRFYDAMADASEHKAREKGLALLDAQPGERVLEIGFGTGQGLVALAEAVGPLGRVTGVDISQGMLDVARKRLDERGLADRVELTLAEAPPLPCDDGSMDAVTLSFTLELFDDATMPRVLDEIRRVLGPAGRLGVVSMAEPAEGERESFMEKTYKWMHHHFPHIVDCRPIDVAARLAAAGFDVVRCDTLDIWSMPVVALVARPGERAQEAAR